MERRIADIRVDGRHRRDLGDMDHLAASMGELGLLQPVVVTPDSRLIAGKRRLEAACRLGWDTIPVHVVDLADVVRGELAENTCRKDFTPSEMVSILRAVGPLVATPTGRPKKTGESFASFSERRAPRTADKVGSYCGVSGRTVEKAKAVVEAAERNPEGFGRLQQWMDRTGRVDRAYKALKRQEMLLHRQEQAAHVQGGLGITTGDFRAAGSTISDGSVDLIFTDPPYTPEAVGLYGDLSCFAARVLRPGGLCLSYVGNYCLPAVLDQLQKHLEYVWQFAVRHGQGNTLMRVTATFQMWKPILAFRRPPREVWWSPFGDMVSGGCEKGDHPWQQAVGEARYFIDRLCPEGGLVCDPFAGSGTTCVAAAQLRRQCVAFEIDPETAARARARLEEEAA